MWKYTSLQVIGLEQHKKTTAANCSEKYAISVSISARNFAERSSIACRYVFENECLGKRVYFDFTDIFIPHLPRLSLSLIDKKRPTLSTDTFTWDRSTTQGLWSSRI
jgi:hypothetical protein